MKARYRLFRRGLRGGAFYCVDTRTGKRTSLHTCNDDEASQIIEAKNQALRQPVLNLQIAKAYLAGGDSNYVRRTGNNRTRYERAIADKAFDPIRDLHLIETHAEHFLEVLAKASVSTNNFLRRFHNFALDVGWLPWPAHQRIPISAEARRRAPGCFRWNGPFSGMEQGLWCFCVLEGSRFLPVVIATSPSGDKYLKTADDVEQPDHLLSLMECSLAQAGSPPDERTELPG